MSLLRFSIAFLCFSALAFGQAPPRTMRLDFYHSGNAGQELYSLDRVVLEPLTWPGNPRKPIDDTNLGKYMFEVRDLETNRVLYSRGFASIYGEWETTGEAKTLNRSFHESLRFPAPQSRVQVVLRKRDARNIFRDAWSIEIDPSDIFIHTSKPAPPGALIEFLRSGDPANKVDFLMLCDGYTSAERGKFERDARRLLDALFATTPFKERKSDFNVWGLCPPAMESGISRPSTGVHLASPLGASYDAFGSERYILTYENRALRQVAQFAPYEFMEILTNTRTYGGGGIFGLYGTVAADSAEAAYVFIHEFGHHFAGLADEYYTSSVAYLPAPGDRVEPWEPNVTALLDPAKLKWRDLLTAGTPIPTPWFKEEFEKQSIEYQQRRARIRAERRPEEEMEALFKQNRDFEVKLFANEKYRTRVGAFEGAHYEAKGYYRSQVDCIMFTRSPEFCEVCRRAIERVIALYTGA
jgi:hypothetical protein